MNRVPGVVVTPYAPTPKTGPSILTIYLDTMERFKIKAKTIICSSTSLFAALTR